MMKNIYTILIFIFLIISTFTIQGFYTRNEKINNGLVIDKLSGEPLAGVEIYIDDEKIYTDLYGKFQIKSDNDKIKIKTSLISYTDSDSIFDNKNNITIPISQYK